MTNEHTHAFLSALAGADAVYDFRAYHDQRRDLPSRIWRGRLQDHLASMQAAQADGFGIHVVMNETDGIGLKRANVVRCRAQMLDLDGVDAAQRMAQVLAGPVAPHMIVRTSPGKAQLWFKVTPHDDLGLHEDNQVRLLRAYGGDDQVVGAERTARLPGFYHLKAEPSLVTVEAGPLWSGGVHDARGIAGALWNISVERAAHADRQALGHGPWQAPSLDALRAALFMMSPNMGRDEWIGITAAFKQAGWSFGEAVIRPIWDEWCGQYTLNKGNDLRENTKQWQTIGDATSSGWPKLERESGYRAARMFAAGVPAMVSDGGSVPLPSAPQIGPGRAPVGHVLDTVDQRKYFDGFFWVASIGKILTHDGVLMDQTKFNGSYSTVTYHDGINEQKSAWKAALEGKVWHIPKVHHMRFLPQFEYGHCVPDEFGRFGVNTYRKPILEHVPGDVTPFTSHVERLIPNERDRTILYSFLAQCAQRPGIKVGWAVLIQSMEGAGKTIFKTIMEAALGVSYVHGPNTQELSDSGGKFNGWIRNRLMIICDEIRTDERRVLIEVLKPLITERRIEIQSKGMDQEMSDNPTNWMMFSNWEDAIPISKKSRRIAPIYSQVQSVEDLERLGMTGQYFPKLYRWVDKEGGASAVAAWLMQYQIPAEFDAQIDCSRAPETSSTAEAIVASRGWLETMIMEAVERQDQGFCGGWLSSVAIGQMVKNADQRLPGPRAISTAIASLGYHKIGLADRVFMQERAGYRTTLYNVSKSADVADYGPAQRYSAVAPAVVPMR